MPIDSVALVGYAQESLPLAKESKCQEMWTVNYAWDKAVPRIDRLFEIHPLWWLANVANSHKAQRIKGGKSELRRSEKHLKWLQEDHPYPIYTYADYTRGRSLAEIELEPYADFLAANRVDFNETVAQLEEDHPAYQQHISIPASMRFPFEESYAIFDNITRGDERKRSLYFTSTISYMLALAIIEEIPLIEVYGIEMGSGTEYVYQKSGTELLIGYAAGVGLNVHLVENSELVNSKLYHEGAQMINRQTCESHVNVYQDQLNAEVGHNNKQRGILKTMEEEGATDEELKEQTLKVAETQAMVYTINGAIQAMQNAIRDIDQENPVIQIINNVEIIPDRKFKERKENGESA
jgi:hypothetical protein